MKRVLILHPILLSISTLPRARLQRPNHEVRAVNILGMGIGGESEKTRISFSPKSRAARGFPFVGSGVDIRTFLKRTSRAARFLPWAALCRESSHVGFWRPGRLRFAEDIEESRISFVGCEEAARPNLSLALIRASFSIASTKASKSFAKMAWKDSR